MQGNPSGHAIRRGKGSIRWQACIITSGIDARNRSQLRCIGSNDWAERPIVKRAAELLRDGAIHPRLGCGIQGRDALRSPVVQQHFHAVIDIAFDSHDGGGLDGDLPLREFLTRRSVKVVAGAGDEGKLVIAEGY